LLIQQAWAALSAPTSFPSSLSSSWILKRQGPQDLIMWQQVWAQVLLPPFIEQSLIHL
jgi:hypothetical protein